MENLGQVALGHADLAFGFFQRNSKSFQANGKAPPALARGEVTSRHTPSPDRIPRVCQEATSVAVVDCSAPGQNRAMAAEKRDLPSTVRALLDERGWTQDHLERRAGLSKGYISRILSGQKGDRMSATRLSSIAEAFGVTVERLLGGDTEHAISVSSSPSPSPEAPPMSTSPEDPCPARTLAAALALEDGTPPGAVARVMALPPDERTVLGWVRAIQDEARRGAPPAPGSASGVRQIRKA